jgi:hypothetical protein
MRVLLGAFEWLVVRPQRGLRSRLVLRRHSIVGLVVTIAVGLASRRVPLGFPLWDKSLGDALYTVMVFFSVVLARPSLAPRTVGVLALAISIVIEVFQLTGIPAQLPRILQLALGTTFAWHDIACYVVGAGLVTLAHTLLTKRSEAGRG